MQVRKKPIIHQIETAIQFDGSQESFDQLKLHLEKVFDEVTYDEKNENIYCRWFCESCEYEKGEWIVFSEDTNKYPAGFMSKEAMLKEYEDISNAGKKEI